MIFRFIIYCAKHTIFSDKGLVVAKILEVKFDS